LLDVDEQATGADKLSDITVPIYIQFKSSHGLHPLRSVAIKPRRNESDLQDIRRFRANHGLADNPTMYFQLREKAAGATDFQHNILFAHHRPQRSYAIYVAPLTLDLDVYYRQLCEGPRYLENPWDWREGKMLTSWGPRVWASRYDFQPFLRKHISIPPHQRVNTHKHYYAFSESGDEVSWHSPEPVEGGPFRLSDFMTQRTREVLTSDSSLPSPEDALSAAVEAISSVEGATDGIFQGETAFDQLRNYGRWLHKSHGIRQMLLCASTKRIQKLQKSIQRYY
jgi:hypothetical protein